MKVFHQDYGDLHDAMKAIEDRKDREASWESPEIERAAKMVRLVLWTIAHNRDIHHVSSDALAKYTAELEAAQAEQRDKNQ